MVIVFHQTRSHNYALVKCRCPIKKINQITPPYILGVCYVMYRQVWMQECILVVHTRV